MHPSTSSDVDQRQTRRDEHTSAPLSTRTPSTGALITPSDDARAHRQNRRAEQLRAPLSTRPHYFGAKAGAGVAQRIINLIPAHALYVEPFAGSAQIYLRKRPADHSILIDADPRTAAALQSYASRACTIHCADAISWLRRMTFGVPTLIYCDPPYVHATRGRNDRYQHEMTDEQHLELLSVLSTIGAAVILSGYPSPLYAAALRTWNQISFKTMTRGGWRDESLWLNYDPPAVPAELTYLGDNFRQRQRIKRKVRRWRAKWRALPPAERAAIMAALLPEQSPAPAMAV
jgi:hypothetical protein